MSKNDIGFSGCFPDVVRPCFFDDECKNNLFCGYKNCPASFGNGDANCCTRNQFKSPNYPNDYFSKAPSTNHVESLGRRGVGGPQKSTIERGYRVYVD